jgi:chromosome segregation protein
MYLKRLEIQGFKTFAQKTALEFMPDKGGRRGVTAVVGPNGSGKSNIADAIRWVMGEQSIKLLRGKKSEDVIFSGSDKRARSGFAEVTMILAKDGQENGQEPDMAEIAVTRRLYRDGQSEYEVNRQAARLQDVALLLAQCGIGQRTYSVIGQGMVDAVLVASPVERKEFFDEAFGLRPFQLKRQAALHKIDESRSNLVQTEALLREIEPRLNSLERQIKRLADRERIEQELRELEKQVYGHGWRELQEALKTLTGKEASLSGKRSALEAEAKKLEGELAGMEQATPASEGLRELQQAREALVAERTALRERQFKLEAAQAVAAVRAEKPWAPLPLSKIIETIDGLAKKHEALEALLAEAKPDLDKIKKLVSELRTSSADLVGKLQRPAPEPSAEPVADPKVGRELEEIVAAMAKLAERTKEAEAKMENWHNKETGERQHIFETQHRLSKKREELESAMRDEAMVGADRARLETRRDGFLFELRGHAPALETELEALSKTASVAPAPDAPAKLQRLRSQLEWIGGIDPETIKDYDQTKERHLFLETQVTDLRGGIQALDTVIAELDTTIRERSATAFRKLDKEFQVFFKRLFAGGEASLVELAPEPEVDEEGNVLEEPAEGAVAGIEIQATPPGKRAKAIALLSGGERALTSIALICAIMATNPSPFVVLDEVDAALDEANSRKFAEIISSLADRTQFVVVTHNRATMAQAHILYGVTMGDDGVSQLLSVKLEEVEKLKKA